MARLCVFVMRTFLMDYKGHVPTFLLRVGLVIEIKLIKFPDKM